MEGIKLTNIWEDFDVFLDELSEVSEQQFYMEFVKKLKDEYFWDSESKQTFVVEEILNFFVASKSFRDIFAYSETFKKDLCIIIKYKEDGYIEIIDIMIAEMNASKFFRKYIINLDIFRNPYSLKNYCPTDELSSDSGINPILNYQENDDVRLIGDWVVTLMEVTPSEQTTEFALSTPNNDNEFSIYFENGKFSHSYDMLGENSNINEETFPLLITECEKWSRELLGIVEDKKDTRIKLSKSKFGNKPGLPSNVSDWLKGNGSHCLEDAKKVSRWYNKLTGGRNFVGGTSIGKSPQTLILDITSNSSDVYINGYDGGIDVCGINVETYKEFCDAIATKYIIM